METDLRYWQIDTEMRTRPDNNSLCVYPVSDSLFQKNKWHTEVIVN